MTMRPAPAETAFAAAFRRAGYDAESDRLVVTANEALRRAGLRPERAVDTLLFALRREPALLRALALEYLKERAADMRGDSLPGGVNRLAPVSGFGSTLPARHSDGAAGGRENGSASPVTRVPPPAASPDGAAAVQSERSAEAVSEVAPAAAPPTCSDGGRASNSLPKGQTRISPVAAPQSPANRAGAAAAWKHAAKSLHDTFLVDGRPIGDLSFGEARRIGRDTGVIHFLLADIVAHVRCPDDTLIRDAIREADLERFISNARRDADVF